MIRSKRIVPVLLFAATAFAGDQLQGNIATTDSGNSEEGAVQSAGSGTFVDIQIGGEKHTYVWSETSERYEDPDDYTHWISFDYNSPADSGTYELHTGTLTSTGTFKQL